MRSGAIDTLRGGACMLLVLYHVVGSNSLNGLRLDEGAWRTVSDALVVLRMPLFALLAGWAYGRSRSRTVPTGHFVALHARRLLLPMLTVGTLFALLQAATPQAHGGARAWTLLHLQPVAHFWFLEALFWVLCALRALEQAGARAHPMHLFGCWALAAALSLLWQGPRWLGLDGAVYLLPYAIAGVALSHPAWNAPLRTRGVQLLLLLVVVLPSLVLLWPPQADPDRRQPAMLLAGTGLCLLLAGWRPEQAALAWLGRQAYPVFLFHPFFTAATRIALTPLLELPLPVRVLAGLVAGLVGPILLARVLRRWRGTDLLLLGHAAPRRPGPSARRRGVSAHHAAESGHGRLGRG